jgi:chromosomal replication initiator protein
MTRILVSDIQRVVAEHYGLSPKIMREPDGASGSRLWERVRPRQIAMFLSHQLTDRSQSHIGQLFGGRDHATVSHAIRVVEQRAERDPKLRADMSRIIEEMGL